MRWIGYLVNQTGSDMALMDCHREAERLCSRTSVYTRIGVAAQEAGGDRRYRKLAGDRLAGLVHIYKFGFSESQGSGSGVFAQSDSVPSLKSSSGKKDCCFSRGGKALSKCRIKVSQFGEIFISVVTEATCFSR